MAGMAQQGAQLPQATIDAIKSGVFDADEAAALMAPPPPETPKPAGQKNSFELPPMEPPSFDYSAAGGGEV